MPSRPPALLDLYGLRVRVRGDWPEVMENVRLDYAWFERSDNGGPPDVDVQIVRRRPDFDAYGRLPASFVTPRNVVYQSGDRTLVDYFGRALAVLDRSTGAIRVEGEDAHLVHEAAYLFILSRAGEHLDARALPRLHALAVCRDGGAVAVLLPSGGGKSTLALRALRAPGVRLLSEDSPLLDRRGRLHPFPLRIGINATDAASLPAGQVRRLERMEVHPKLAVDLEAFADRIEAGPVALRHVVIGRRTLGREPVLAPAPRSAAVGPLFREAVVGLGIYQGMEFVLQRGMRDVAAKAGTAATRAACCAAALAGARVWRLDLGRDHDRNWAAVESLLR